MAVVQGITYIYKVRLSGSITAQRKLKNFEDLLLIDAEKFEYMRQMYLEGNFSIPFTYCLDTVYEFECCVIENRRLSFSTKKCLISRIRKTYHVMKPYNRELTSLKYRLLYVMQIFPSPLIYMFVRLRLLFNK